jgi:L-lactate dehydrogenase (cytochrome)
VQGRAEVILDGGVRRGGDVLKALALGARACMTGRPFLYGLAAGGERGVAQAIGLFASEIDNNLALLGRPSARTLDRTALRWPR